MTTSASGCNVLVMKTCWHDNEEETATEWFCPDCGAYESYDEFYEVMGDQEGTEEF